MNEYIITLYFRDGTNIKLDYYDERVARSVFYNHISDPVPEVYRVVLSRIVLEQIDSWEE